MTNYTNHINFYRNLDEIDYFKSGRETLDVPEMERFMTDFANLHLSQTFDYEGWKKENYTAYELEGFTEEEIMKEYAENHFDLLETLWFETEGKKWEEVLIIIEIEYPEDTMSKYWD